MKHNPEKRAWRGRSYRKGGERIADLRRNDARRAEIREAAFRAEEIEATIRFIETAFNL